MRPGAPAAGRHRSLDAWLGQQPRRAPADKRVELSVEIVSLGRKGERALCGAAQRSWRDIGSAGLGGLASERSGGSSWSVASGRNCWRRRWGALTTSAFGVVDRARAGPHRVLPGGDQDPDGPRGRRAGVAGPGAGGQAPHGGWDRFKVIGLGAVRACRAARTSISTTHWPCSSRWVLRPARSCRCFHRPDPAAWCLLDGEPVNLQVAIGVGGTVRCARAAPVGVTTAAVWVAVWCRPR
jgi:hypothetical protein